MADPDRHLDAAARALHEALGKDAPPKSRVLLPTAEGGKNVRTFGYGALCNDLGEEMARPYLPTFAVLLGAEPVLFALIISIEELVNRLVRPVAGAVSDRVGRKPPVLSGYLAISAYRIGVSMSSVWWLLVPFVSLRQFGRGFRDAAREACVAESAPKEVRGRRFGFINAMDTVGAVTGPVVGLLLLSLLTYGTINLNGRYSSVEPFRVLFLVAALPTFLSAAIIALRLRETHRPLPAQEAPGYWDSLRQGFRLYAANRRLLVYTLANCVFAAGALPMIMILAYVQLSGGWNATFFDVMYLAVIYAIVHAVASYPAGMIADHWGRRTAQIAGDFIAVAAFVAFALAPSPVLAIPGFILYGLFEALWVVSRRTVIADLAPEEARAQALGTFSMFYGLAGFIAPVLFTLIWIYRSAQLAFLVLAGIVLVAALVLAVAAPPPKPKAAAS